MMLCLCRLCAVTSFILQCRAVLCCALLTSAPHALRERLYSMSTSAARGVAPHHANCVLRVHTVIPSCLQRGQTVVKQAYCEVEVMKMYMPLCVRESGVVRWHLSEGAALKPGDRLATLELDDPTAVTKAEVREGAPQHDMDSFAGWRSSNTRHNSRDLRLSSSIISSCGRACVVGIDWRLPR